MILYDTYEMKESRMLLQSTRDSECLDCGGFKY